MTVRNSLSSLLDALQAGLAPSVAASEFAAIMAQRQAQQQARQQQRQALTEQILGIASSGQPLSSAGTYLSSLAEAGIVRPRMQDRLEGVLNTAYGLPARPTFTAPGRGEIEGTLPLSRVSPQTLSPLAPPPQPAELPGPVEELAEMADALRVFATQGMSKQQAMAAILATSGLSSTDPNAILLLQRLADEVYRDLGVGP